MFKGMIRFMIYVYISLKTDWNDGYNLCAIVESQGGHIEGWPNLDRSDHVGNCQKGVLLFSHEYCRFNAILCL